VLLAVRVAPGRRGRYDVLMSANDLMSAQAQNAEAVSDREPALGAQDHYVLLVEDDPDIRESVELILSLHGHQVTAVENGAEALGWLTSGHAPPCMILLDLMMPRMNGYELRCRMTEDPSLAPIPVVVVTGAGAQVEHRWAELNAPVLRKPINLPELLATVARFCPCGKPAVAH
jgi:two-component system chemotaxis response regulator CheY